MSKFPHDPSRFEKFLELPDGSGFTLPDGKIFLFDSIGGWYLLNNKFNFIYIFKV